MALADLGPIEFKSSFDPAALRYDPQFGGFAVRHADTQRLLVFRGHQRLEGEFFAPQELLYRSETEARHRNSLYGFGVYAGNTPQSVGAFAPTNLPKEIGAYLTPSFSNDEVLHKESFVDTRASLAKGFASSATDAVRFRHADPSALATEHDKEYGISRLVIFNMNAGTRVLQRLIHETYRHPRIPLWYLWRDQGGQFERVGTATERLAVRPTVLKALTLRDKVKRS